MPNIQSEILNKIIARFSKKSDAVDTISEELQLGKDAIYRRIRGDSLLTPDEITHLARKFNISLDDIVLEDRKFINFTFNAFTRNISTIEDYIRGVIGNIDKVKSLGNLHMYNASEGLPYFYYAYIPELMGFKMYTWAKSIWNFKYLKDVKFDFNLMSSEAKDLSVELIRKYNLIPVTELWTSNIMNNTLNQIEYMFQAGFFKRPDDALILCDMLADVAGHLKKMVLAGCKFSINGTEGDSNVPFELYHNEMIYTNNMILIKADGFQTIFCSFESPNFIRSTERRICEHVDSWFENIMEKTSLLDSSQSKQLNWYFERVDRNIKNSKKKIEAHAFPEDIFI